MREVAIIAYHQTPMVRDAGAKNDVELVMEAVHGVKNQLKITNADIDFVCSGSCDYLGGAAFAFVGALDAIGAVPPMSESHVEMDAAWALYEAWLKIQTGHFNTALIYGFGKSSHDARSVGAAIRPLLFATAVARSNQPRRFASTRDDGRWQVDGKTNGRSGSKKPQKRQSQSECAIER